MRILVTGSREWTDRLTAAQAILNALPDHEQVVIVHGGARGADSIASAVAYFYDLGEEVHPADWAKHGKVAGPIRNQEMVDAGADLCLAFLKEGAANRGTKDCIGRAEAAGIPVRRIEGGGGVREPSGDSPDSPPAGGSRLPGGSDDYLPVAFAGDDPADLWEHIIPVSPEEFTRDTRVDWPILPAGVTYQDAGGFKMWMEPDGSWHQEILPATVNSEAKVPS